MNSHYEQVDVAEPGAEAVEIQTADLFEVLRNRRRRFVVLCVDRFGEITLGEVAERIATVEREPPIRSQDRKAIYVGLYQEHVDKIADAGIIEYDERGKVLSRSAWTGQAADYIRDGYNRFACFEGASEVLA